MKSQAIKHLQFTWQILIRHLLCIHCCSRYEGFTSAQNWQKIPAFTELTFYCECMLGTLEHTGKQTVLPGDIDNLVEQTSMQKIHEVITSSSDHNSRKGHKLEGEVWNGLHTQEELGEEVGGRGDGSIEKQVRLRALKLGRSWVKVEGGVRDLGGWMQEHIHRHRRKEGASEIMSQTVGYKRSSGKYISGKRAG